MPLRSGDLAWFLCDFVGNPIKQLHQREDGKVGMALNDRRTANVTIPLDDPAAYSVQALATILKVWYRAPRGQFWGNDPIFAGPITNPRKRGKDGKLDIEAQDIVFRLERTYTRDYGWGAGPRDIPHALWDLVISSNSRPGLSWGLGVQQGSLAGGSNFIYGTGFEKGINVWDKQQEWAAIFGAPDFTYRPVHRTDGIHWFLDTGDLGPGSPLGIGNDKSATVKFEYNCLRHNCVDMEHAPGGDETTTRATEYGSPPDGDTVSDNGPTATSYAAAAELLVGPYEQFESNDRTDLAYQQARSQELVAAYHTPPDFITIKPAPEGEAEGFGVPPRFGVDYFLGDLVRAIGRKKSLHVDEVGRLMGVELAERDQDSGVEVTLDFAPRPTATTITTV